MEKHKRVMIIYLDEEQMEWLDEKAEQGFKKAGLLHMLISQCMEIPELRENPASLKKLVASINAGHPDPMRPGVHENNPVKAAPKSESITKKAAMVVPTETPKEREERIEGYVEAIEYFMDHPEAKIHPVLRAIVNSIQKDVDEAIETDAGEHALTRS